MRPAVDLSWKALLYNLPTLYHLVIFTVPMESSDCELLENIYFVCVSNVVNKQYAQIKQNRCIFVYILVWNMFSDLYVTCGQDPNVLTDAYESITYLCSTNYAP